MIKKIAILISVLALFQFVSDSGHSTTRVKTSVVNTMHGMAKKFEELGVFSTADSKLTDEELGREIKTLKTKLKEVKPEDLPPSRTYRITLNAIQQHLDETDRVFRVGNKQYAKWMLNATTSLCVMCHTQMPRTQKLQSFWTYKPVSPMGRTAFQDGEFLFVTRRFAEALPYYDSVVRTFPSNKIETTDVDVSIRRKLAYFARYSRDFKDALLSLEQDYKNEQLPLAIRNNLQAWIGMFRKISKEKAPNLQEMTSQQVLKWANDQFKKTLWDKMIPAEDPRIVSHLYVSGILYETLFNRPADSSTPEMLLLLARSENVLNQQFFYSMGDLYLRECINEFPKSPVAKECYKELASSVGSAYQSTTGQGLPLEVDAQLKQYRLKIGIE